MTSDATNLFGKVFFGVILLAIIAFIISHSYTAPVEASITTENESKEAAGSLSERSPDPTDDVGFQAGSETVTTERIKLKTHVVRSGDTIGALAGEYLSSVAAIMDANDLTDDVIYVQQKLIIPIIEPDNRTELNLGESTTVGTSEASMLYEVRQGESLYLIGKRYGTSIESIADANGIENPSRVRAGERLIIPGRKEADIFLWPIEGRITSDYGWRIHPIYKNRQFHGGLDIASPLGTSVRASSDGVVVQAEDMGGFGLGVVIDHGNGITSWYGHNSQLLVAKGDRIAKGQTIAKVGSTGISTGPHVDFRIKADGRTVDPKQWLEKRGQR